MLEFGVAGGDGLVALQAVAAEAERALGVGVRVYGFDTGKGLPPPRDHRDAPFLMEGGDFPMDEEALRSRLERAELVLGDVDRTVPDFLESRPAPVGFISFDLDYYSSTRDALRLLDGDSAAFLPRVLCYFDDVHCYPWGDSIGARLAIREFNEERRDPQDRRPSRHALSVRARSPGGALARGALCRAPLRPPPVRRVRGHAPGPPTRSRLTQRPTRWLLASRRREPVFENTSQRSAS